MANSPSSNSSSSISDHVAPQPAPASVVQTVNIHSHVPVLLNMNESNYSQWRCFLDSVLHKFSLDAHVHSPPPLHQRNTEWRMNDHSVINWLYTTVTKDVFDLIHKPCSSAFTVWNTMEGLFCDNDLQHIVYFKVEFRSLQQGDMNISHYCTRLKTLTDNLRDIEKPISEPNQVLNMLRNLNPKYRHVIPIIKSKFPPHTFMSARSYLLMEELHELHNAKMEVDQAFFASHGGSPSSAFGPADGGSGSGSNRNKNCNKKCGRGSVFNYGSSNSSATNGTGGAPQ
ncbi:uncharacterized protein LOC133903105 [Phragmites australis]|uniref:uncharacterized protein LOC133903105 n=1 Tax=Phragmites australis TaxID=29695 RepID=UPI002D784A44|nr:uncharacterized protein LOC133903105 [Phragmites australis]